MRHPRDRSFFQGSMDRREFLKRSATTGLAFSSLGAFLAACGKAPPANLTPSSSASKLPFPLARPNHPVTWPIYPDNQPIASGLSPESNATFKIYNWDQYIDTTLTKKFGKEFKCKVEISTFASVDEGLSKLHTGQVDFDVYFPDPSLIGKLITAKLLRPLNHDYIPNLKNLWPSLQDPFYDKGSLYTIPYTIYTTGIGWRNDHVKDDIAAMANPYETFWNTAYKGKIHLLDDYRETIGMALLKNGHIDLNTEDQKLVNLAKDDLLKLIPAVNVKLDTNDYQDLPEGGAWLHQSWSGDLVSAQYYLPKGVPVDVLSYWYPPNGGGAIGSDNIVALTSGKNPVLAHEFLNFMLDNDNAYFNMSDFNGYQPPISFINPDNLVSDEVVPANLKSAVVRPDVFDKGYIYLELSPNGDAMWHSA